MLLSSTTLKLLALVFLVHFVSVFSQQEDDGEGNVTSTTNSNLIDENSNILFTNYNALREEGQGFFLKEGITLREPPESSLVPWVTLIWWCDLEFNLMDTDMLDDQCFTS
jgi:hypothetical protein